MADLNKFEEMLERLINEDKEGAEELFHEIVVEKSRDIYESLLEDEAEDEEVDEASDDEDEVEESSEEDEDDDLEENFNLDEFEVEADPMGDMMGGDETDDMMGDVEMPDGEEGEEGEEGDVEDRVEDLEDALDELKAEFEKMMSGEDGEEGEEGEEGEMDMDMDMDAEEPEEESYNFESNRNKSQTEQMREYVEKVTAKMGDNGANTKSTVAGKNDMGGTAANMTKGGTASTGEVGKGKMQGSALSDQNAKEDSAGNVNVPGGKASKSMTAQSNGHGAEKRGQGESAANKKSIVGGK